MFQVNHVLVGVVSAYRRLVHRPDHVLWTDGSAGQDGIKVVNIKRKCMLQNNLSASEIIKTKFTQKRGNKKQLNLQ